MCEQSKEWIGILKEYNILIYDNSIQDAEKHMNKEISVVFLEY